MSLPNPSPRPAPAKTTRPRRGASAPLRSVEAVGRPRSGRLRQLVAMVAILAGVIVLQLVLSILLIQGAYAEDRLAADRVDAQRHEAAAAEDLGTVSSAQQLAASATELGMVPVTGAGYLDVASGTFVADPGTAAAEAPIDPALVGNAAAERDAASDAQTEGRAAEEDAAQPQPEPEPPSIDDIAAPSTH